MSDLETRLAAALQEEVPPAGDALFRIEVLVRVERARFRRRVVRAVTAAALAAALVSVNVSAIEAWIAAGGHRLGIVALFAAVTMFSITAVAIDLGATTLTGVFDRLLSP
jgi:hypothetical protein